MEKRDGKASGKARKQKKFIRENLESLLEMELKDTRLKSRMVDLGVVDDFSLQNAISCAVVQKALLRRFKSVSNHC